jgi:hypothetical protein
MADQVMCQGGPHPGWPHDFERRVRHLIEALEQARGTVPLPASVTDAMGPVISALRGRRPATPGDENG